jgi:hypothetical protein
LRSIALGQQRPIYDGRAMSALPRPRKRTFGCVFMSPRPRLMGTVICDDLRHRLRNQKVSFYHSHGANAESATKNKECEIPSHRCSLARLKECTDRADRGVTAVTKHRFYLAPPKRIAMHQSIDGPEVSLWVISDRMMPSVSSPLYPRKRHAAVLHRGTQWGHKFPNHNDPA